jgi:DNA-binding transcriptional MocR family regulator
LASAGVKSSRSATVPAADLLARARDEGVAFELGSGFSPVAAEERCARLAFSFASPDELREGVRRLGATMAQLRS